MTTDVTDQNAGVPLVEVGRVSVWIPWYFRHRALTILTGPLFLLLLFCIAVAGAGALVQALALFRVSKAVLGFVGILLVVTVGWIPVILPPVLYYSLLKNLPGLWLRPNASRRAKVATSAAVMVLLPLMAYLIQRGVGLGIGWIADRNPCAAFAAGVTGSKPPVGCE